jgi:hypothetical protein
MGKFKMYSFLVTMVAACTEDLAPVLLIINNAHELPLKLGQDQLSYPHS